MNFFFWEKFNGKHASERQCVREENGVGGTSQSAAGFSVAQFPQPVCGFSVFQLLTILRRSCQTLHFGA
jgi:hypothetical protein